MAVARIGDAAAPGVKGATDTRVLGTALIDVTTGEFTVAEYAGEAGLQAFAEELRVLQPRELVLADDLEFAAWLPGDEPWRAGDPRGPLELRSRLGT